MNIQDIDNQNEILKSTIQKFMINEFFPLEEKIDKLGYVPDEIGKHIQKKSQEIGLYAANLPEIFGGGGLNYSEMLIMEREFGKTSHALHSWIARPTEILLACNETQKKEYLIPCIDGEKRELFALSEPEAGSDIMSMKTTAQKKGNNWILNGTKHFISGPCLPDFAIVFAVTKKEMLNNRVMKSITAFLVDINQKGFEIEEGYKCISYKGYKNYKLYFNDLVLSEKNILGNLHEGLELCNKWLGMGRVWVGATCCGKAERIFNLTKEWASTRKQFGREIGKFQGVSFKIADMAVGLKTADLLVENTVKLANNKSMKDSDAAMVKLYCSEMLNKTADDAVQIYGGMGLMEEFPIERLWRDSRLERIWDGTSEIQRHIISKSVLTDNE